jgi:hypothetical protein
MKSTMPKTLIFEVVASTRISGISLTTTFPREELFGWTQDKFLDPTGHGHESATAVLY